MKNNKGFTLMEILAVVIILGVIASVSFPIVKNTINNNRKKSFEASLDGMVRSVELYITNDAITRDITFDYNDDNIKNQNSAFVSGEISYVDGVITLTNLSNGEYCASGTKGNYVVAEGACPQQEGSGTEASDPTTDTGYVPTPTSESCFDFDSATGTITGYKYSDSSCPTDSVVIPETIGGITIKYIGENAFIKGVRNVDYVLTSTNSKYKKDIIENMENPGYISIYNNTSTATKKCYYNSGSSYDEKPINYIIDSSTNYEYCDISTVPGYYYYEGIKNINFSLAKSLISIGDYSFYDSLLSSVTFGQLENLTSIGNSSFGYSNISKTIDLSNLTKLDSIGNYSFGYNNIPNVLFPISIKTINNYAFFENNIEAVDFSNTQILSIGDNAFGGNNIISMKLNTKITSIGNYAFQGNSITSVVIPNSLTSLGYYAFSNNMINNLSIGNGLKIIPLNGFDTNLLESVTIPATVTSVYPFAFARNRIASIDILSSDTILLGGIFNDNKMPADKCFIFSRAVTKTLVSYACEINKDIVVPSNTVIINDYAFSELYATSITIPNSVTTIGSYAFDNALKDNNAVVSIGTGIKTLSDTAFYCYSSSKCAYTININKTTNSIADSPWGNSYATVNWTGSN